MPFRIYVYIFYIFRRLWPNRTRSSHTTAFWSIWFWCLASSSFVVRLHSTLQILASTNGTAIGNSIFRSLTRVTHKHMHLIVVRSAHTAYTESAQKRKYNLLQAKSHCPTNTAFFFLSRRVKPFSGTHTHIDSTVYAVHTHTFSFWANATGKRAESRQLKYLRCAETNMYKFRDSFFSWISRSLESDVMHEF